MDKKIKEKLEGISPKLDASSWEQLSERMDRMDDTAWDDRIKEHLETAAVGGAALSSWEALSNKLDASEDRAFDQNMEEKLENVEGGTPMGWSSLEEKWMAWQKMRKDFIALRAIEVVAILLLIFSLHQWGAIWKDSLWDVAQSDQTEITSEAAVSALSLDDNQSVENDSEYEDQKSKQLVPKVEYKETTRNSGQKNKTVSSAIERGASPSANATDESQTSQIIGKTTIPENAVTDKVGSNIAASSSLLSQMKVAGHNQILSATEILSSSAFGLIGEDHEELSPYRKSWYIQNVESKRAPIWMSLYTTLGYNQVNRPAVDTFESAMYNQPYIGGGLQVSFENGRWHLSSGIEYHQTRVTSGRTLAHVDGSGAITFVTLNDARIKFFTLPILINYSIIQNKRHRMYALAGARLHISSGINYNFSFDYGPGATGSEPIDEMGIHGVSDVNFTYFTINGGLGYEHMINDRLGLFGSAGVELFGQNNSLFPNGEKINVFRFDTGLRIRL